MPMDRMKMVSLEPGWNRSTVQNWTADNFRDHETSPSHHQRGTKARWLNPALAAETVGRSVEPSSRRDGFGCDGETSERVAADTTILWNLKYFSLSKLPLYRINKGGYQIKLRLPPLPSPPLPRFDPARKFEVRVEVSNIYSVSRPGVVCVSTTAAGCPRTFLDISKIISFLSTYGLEIE